MVDWVGWFLQIVQANLGTVVAAIAGIVATYIVYQKSQRRKEPIWDIRSSNLIRDFAAKVGDLEIKYKGENVENFTMSRVMFWNKGKETIRGDDIASASPLKVAPVDDVKLLDVKLLQLNNPASQFSVDMDAQGQSALVRFDYLDQGQGGVFQVFHSGTSSEGIRVLGEIKGAGTPRMKHIIIFQPGWLTRRIGKGRAKTIRMLTSLFPFIFFLFYLYVVLTAVVLALASDSGSPERAWTLWVIVFIAPLFIRSLFKIWDTIFAEKTPSGLEVFEQEL